jgi:hypothetical protein
MDDKPGTLTLMVGSVLAGIFILGIIAILSDLFDSSTTSKGRLLARKERYVIERTEYYERKVEHQHAEFVKAEIFEPERLLEIYGRKKKAAPLSGDKHASYYG